MANASAAEAWFPATDEQTVAISRCGELIAARDADTIEIFDASGRAGSIDAPAASDFAWIGAQLWVATAAGLRILARDGTRCAELALAGARTIIPAGSGALAGNHLVLFEDGELVARDLGDGEPAVGFLGGLRALRAHGRRLRVTDPGRELYRLQLPGKGVIARAVEVLDGAAIAVEGETPSGRAIDLVKLPGTLIRHIELPDARAVAFAASAGLALVTTRADELVAVDLRYGRVADPVPAPFAGCHVDIDDRAEHVALARRTDDRLAVFRLEYRELFSGIAPEAPVPAPAPVPIAPRAPEAPARTLPAIPRGPLVALIAPEPSGPAAPSPTKRATAYSDPSEHLSDLITLTGARAMRATCDDEWRQRASELEARIAGRVATTLAAGLRLPLCDLAGEFELCPAAIDALMTAAAPAMSVEVARLYRNLSGDDNRSLCDRGLVVHILGGDADRLLAPSGSLLASGLLEEGPASSPVFAPITAAAPVLERLRGAAGGPRPGAVTTMVRSRYAIGDLPVEREPLIALVRHLQRPIARPARVVVRGRPGLGRVQLLAAVAKAAGRSLAVIDAERLPSGAGLPEALRRELVRARIWGAVPCVVGFGDRGRQADDGFRPHVREVLRTFAGPIMFATDTAFDLPIDPGYFAITLPTPSESARLAHWQSQIAAAGLHAGGAETLARRTRLGPTAIDAVCAEVAAAGLDGDATERLAGAARQRIDASLGSIATRVERLAPLDKLALPAATLEAITELVSRSRHRRTVFDDWGFDAAVTSSRGLVALFSGPPGTGKTVVAGAIARELGLDLYRVDLASVISKWIGETEKNLARLFDAAEDSQAVLLFDEADTLFSRRTEVRSSNDRHANMETGYLLQRLDAFEGIAILTTNLNKSIDPAVARRLSMRVEFDFPDDETRAAIWRAHLPETLPTAGELELSRLARDYPMTGGRVRNCALRAAFLAAEGGVALTREHLVRAIELEYQQAGRISASGRLE